VAVIVAEAGKVTIYDGDDPDLPMWMVFATWGGVGSTVSSLYAKNAKLYWGAVNGILSAHFLSDFLEFRQISNIRTQDTISTRGAFTATTNGSTEYIVNNTVNDVAMTVLPNAPTDSATGLPVPTIAVATDGGVSVIKDDGTVVDITDSSGNGAWLIGFTDDSRIMFQHGGAATGINARIINIPTSDVSSFGGAYYANSPSSDLKTPLASLYGITAHGENKGLGFSSPGGLVQLSENTTTPSEGMVAYTTSDYNTGWMNGDIKGAFLSDTDDTDLVGATLYTSDFSSTTDGWTATGAGSLAAVSSELELTGDGGYNDESRKTLTTVIGQRYIVQGKFRKGTNVTARVQIKEAFGSYSTKDVAETTSSVLVDFTLEFVATGTAYNLSLVDWTSFGGTCYITDVTIKLADEDRSVNDNGLIVNGTVTRAAVATGADLVAYSGFSSSNYLEQPYNSDLDFGTGDFCVMGWVKPTANGQHLMWRGVAGAGAGLNAVNLGVSSSGYPFLRVTDGSEVPDVLISSSPITLDAWSLIAGIRESGTLKIYLNGAACGTLASTRSVTNTAATLIVGAVNYAGTLGSYMGAAALLRISATAPTADQIAKIYEDEKVLFQENAEATLYGSSDAVTALAHDPDTDLLHVGTSAGRSVFDGLRRIDNTTDAVTTAISASGGFILEQ
jgi:hypothetical protein